MFGLGRQALKTINYRLESLNIDVMKQYHSSKWIILLRLLNEIIPSNKNIKDRFLLNIFFLDLTTCYKGWRHSRGLPVRGQRTWTNAWTTYRNNLILREYKVIIAKKLYGNLPTDSLAVTHLAEQINLLWKLQWENEWKEAKKKRLVSIKSNFKAVGVDLYSMSKGIVDTSGNTKNKNVKSNFNKNLFTLGFDPGFTKALIKANYVSQFKNTKTKKSNNRVNLVFSKPSTKKK